MTSRASPLPPRAPFIAALAVAIAAASAAGQQTHVVASQDTEGAARAAMLRASIVLKIAPYLTAETPPAAPPTTYRIAVVGTDAVATAMLAHLPGKRVGAATVAVIEIDAAAAATRTRGDYDLLYIAASVDGAAVKRIVDAHTARPVPVVCERPGFAAGGGSVQLFVQDNGVRFEINVDALKKQGMRASPQLLKLSRKGPA